eukprot:TRINITY_DN10816_c0_g1_i1.p1 TRINITY_DN10816_c0_g1~~TRINITY_DN10816_c0_g1_i1.p1  ORF type:complete len:413 (+),score=150.92 TRINITY_DN10816_c0_g1_i1:32-1240(+)
MKKTLMTPCGILQVLMMLCMVSVCLAVSAPAPLLTLEVQVLYNGKNTPSSMYLRGDGLGLNWNSGIAMKSVSQYTWSYTLTYNSSVVGNTLQMKPLVGDKTWSIGTNFMVILPFSSSSVQLFPFFYSKQGQYSVVGRIFSPQLNNTRDVIVYTPPSYYENTLKTMTNVLTMHDGQNLFNASTSFAGVAWNCQTTVDQLVVEGAMDEVLIVGVYNTGNRLNEYTYSYDPCYQKTLGICQGGGGEGDLYLDFLVDTLTPWIASRFRVETQPSNMGILGSSLGGLISCYAAWTRPEVWSKGGCMSSSFWWNSRDFNGVILKSYPAPLGEKIYLDSGDCCPEPSGDDRFQTLQIRNDMENLGFSLGTDLFYYLDKGGQHSEYYWGHRFNQPMQDLYPPSFSPVTAI